MSMYYSDGSAFHEITPSLIGADPATTQIGGRNLLKGTSATEKTATYPSTGYTDYFYGQTTYAINESTYTLSFWAKSTKAGDKVYCYFFRPNDSKIGDGATFFTLTTSMAKYSVTWTLADKPNAKKSVICPRLMSHMGTGTVTYCKLKLEVGNKATDWTPAPEDGIAWSDVTGKPSTYPPSTHEHPQYYSSTTTRTKNTVLASPNGKDGTASFRALTANDIPKVNSASKADNVTGVVAIANGGTGATDAATARANLNAQVAGYYMTSGEYAGDIDTFWTKIRGHSGMTGSVSITKKDSGVGSEIPGGWYNFFYSPHRNGLSTGGDNDMYANILICPMTSAGDSWILRASNTSKAITGVRKIIDSINIGDLSEISVQAEQPTNSNCKLWIKI